MLNILHLFNDGKFLDLFSQLTTDIPDICNHYLVPSGTSIRLDFPVHRRVDRQYFGSGDMHADLAWCDCLIVHFMEYGGARMVLSAPATVTVIWSGWGGDYERYLDPNLYGPETLALRKTLNRTKLQPIRKLKDYLIARTHRRATQRANLFSSPLKADYVALKAALGETFQADFVQLNYGSIADSYPAPGNGLPAPTEETVLLGNSATDTNNHIEALRIIAAASPGDRRVLVPLSYGDEAYRDAVIAKGHEILGSNFTPLLNNLPMAEYNQLLSGCTTGLMNHHRQQGLGNINTLLANGSRVYLNHRSPIYIEYQQRGANLFDIESFSADPLRFTPLQPDEAEQNREVVNQLWSDAVVRENLRNAVDTMNRRAATR